MRRALELAAHGFGSTKPNPMVGAVIVAPDGRIIGEGYHRRCGEGHAEVNAVASVAESDLPLLEQATMYVTLEPCSHQGRTPPCAKMIIDRHIPRVVVGATDPFVKVSGRGIAMLREAGVDVRVGELAAESECLNAVFMTAHRRGRPFVFLKWAQSANGCLDHVRTSPFQKPVHFSNDKSAMLTHRLRAVHEAILVGSGTVLADNPRLDTRLWHGSSPRPVILDGRGRLTDIQERYAGRDPIVYTGELSVEEILHDLYARGITSVLVEGGAEVLRRFVESGLWDAAQTETAPFAIEDLGAPTAPELETSPIAIFIADENIIRIYSNNPLFTPYHPLVTGIPLKGVKNI